MTVLDTEITEMIKCLPLFLYSEATGFLFKYFPQHKALFSYFAVIPEIPKRRVCTLGQTPQALVWKWRQNFTFKINIPSVNAPTSTNKVFIFKLTIEDYYKNDSELIGSNFLLLAPIKSVAFFSGTPGIK